MGLAIEEKQEIVKKFGSHETDCGSDSVRTHSKYHHGRRGLLKMVGRRRRLLQYLRRTDLNAYRNLIKELGLRR